MKTTSATVLIAAGALAQLASAQPHVGHQHLHKRVKEVTVTDIDYVTVTEYITVGAASASASASANKVASSKASSATSSASSFNAKVHWHQHSSKTSTVASSSASSDPVFSGSAYGQSTAAAASTSSPSPSSRKTSTSSAALSAYSTSKASSASLSAYSTAKTSSAALSAHSTVKTSSKAASSTSSAAAAASSSSSSSSSLGYSGIKAGLSGYIGCENTTAFESLAPYIGWYSDYTATTADAHNVVGVPMLWGDGVSCSSVSSDRLTDFKSAVASETPKLMFGFYEPDCDCSMSSEISEPTTGLQMWNEYLAPLKAKGTVLGSPSMCTQYDESWLKQFHGNATEQNAVSWDVTSIHINKNSSAGAIKDVEYYWNTYGKPIWVSEFACVNDNPSWNPCDDQDTIDTFIQETVAYFESNPNVIAYGPSNGEGLGTVWPLTDSSTGELTATGNTYLSVVKGLASKK